MSLIKTGLMVVGGLVVGNYLIKSFGKSAPAEVAEEIPEAEVVEGPAPVGSGEESNWTNFRGRNRARRLQRWFDTGGRRGALPKVKPVVGKTQTPGEGFVTPHGGGYYGV